MVKAPLTICFKGEPSNPSFLQICAYRNHFPDHSFWVVRPDVWSTAVAQDIARLIDFTILLGPILGIAMNAPKFCSGDPSTVEQRAKAKRSRTEAVRSFLSLQVCSNFSYPKKKKCELIIKNLS